jgi:outer membrane autotransporter protein
MNSKSNTDTILFRKKYLSLQIAFVCASISAFSLSHAGVLDGTTATVDRTSTAEAWTLTNGATLNVIAGGMTNAINASSGSTVDINGGTVTATSGTALTLTNSNASITGATIVNTNGFALSLNPVNINSPSNSSAQISDSTLSGVGRSFTMNNGSDLLLSNTQVNATQAGSSQLSAGIGGVVLGGTVVATNNTHIVGDANGLLISTERGSNLDWTSNVTLDQSTVEGRKGAAIVVDSLFSTVPNFVANIVVNNGSNLLGGNGNLLEITDSNTANLTVDRSALTGNVVADATSIANVTLQNQASLTGQLTNVSSLALNSGAVWNMVGDANVAAVNMNGGTINFNTKSGDAFRTLTLGTLAGTGTFEMSTDLVGHTGDLLKVTGNASGDYSLHIKNTGEEPLKGVDPLKLVETGGGNAQFDAVGGKVDAGAFEYTLKQEGNDWFLVQSVDEEGKPITTPSADAALGLFSTAPTVWYGEMATLRSRMGELRMGQANGGAWARTYGRKYNVNGGSGQEYRQNQYGISIGADAPVSIQNGQLLVGGLAGYSKSDLDFSAGTTGTVDSYYAGVYATWIADSGFYLDALVKANRFLNRANVRMSDGVQAAGGYNNYGLGTSVEFGRHIALGNDWFVEPMMQFSALRIKGDNYSLNNGLNADNGHTNSVQLKLGATAGRTLKTADGSILQPYLKVAAVQEFAKNNNVIINDNQFNNNISGTRGEVGFGIAAQLRDKVQLHADMDYSKGSKIEQPWGVNIGIRYNW